MVLGATLAKAAVGSEIARNGIVGTLKGVGEVLSGIRQGVITVVQDVQKMTGNWKEPEDKTTKNKKIKVEEGKAGE